MITEDDVHRYFWSVAITHARPATASSSASISSLAVGPSNALVASTSASASGRAAKGSVAKRASLIVYEARDGVTGASSTEPTGQVEVKKRKKRKEAYVDIVLSGQNGLCEGGRSGSEKDKGRTDAVAIATEGAEHEGRVKGKKKKQKKEREDSALPPPDFVPPEHQQGDSEKKKRKKKKKERIAPIPTPIQTATPTPLEQERMDEDEIDELLPSSPVGHDTSTSPPPPPSPATGPTTGKKRKRDSSTFDLSAESPSLSLSKSTGKRSLTSQGHHHRSGEVRVVRKLLPTEVEREDGGGPLSALPAHLVGTPMGLKGNERKGSSKGHGWPTWATSTPDFVKKRKAYQA